MREIFRRISLNNTHRTWRGRKAKQMQTNTLKCQLTALWLHDPICPSDVWINFSLITELLRFFFGSHDHHFHFYYRTSFVRRLVGFCCDSKIYTFANWLSYQKVNLKVLRDLIFISPLWSQSYCSVISFQPCVTTRTSSFYGSPRPLTGWHRRMLIRAIKINLNFYNRF